MSQAFLFMSLSHSTSRDFWASEFSASSFLFTGLATIAMIISNSDLVNSYDASFSRCSLLNGIVGIVGNGSPFTFETLVPRGIISKIVLPTHLKDNFLFLLRGLVHSSSSAMKSSVPTGII